ncbi:MAG: DegT/DnrJ/EryC1/StrS family aminotransferase, partial [Gammaproteobacteria bacterium]|nr:DegT/DnrJ/EryC1/StrS family aminotransferase [Gammaproteobacteria bacterium]
MLEANFPPWPYYAEDEISAVSEVLRSGCVNYWTGDIIKDFEREFSRYVGTEYAIALSNGTVAIDLALHALEIGKGDEVIVTSRTFIATASSIALAGAVPIFADVDAISQNITADTIAACITKKTKAIILVHLAGWPCDMDPIMALAKEKGLFVIEDCAQAHGASYKGQKVGSMGDIATFSFCQDKIISTGGEGGMLVTNNKDYFERAWS